jgi:signal transduction histidine kinase
MEGLPYGTDHEPGPELTSIRLTPGRRELALIVAFWTGYALLTLANRVLDPSGAPPGSVANRAVLACAESLCWMIITPVLFWLAGRADLEGAGGAGRRFGGLVTLVVAGIGAALLVGWMGTQLRLHLIAPSYLVQSARGFGGSARVVQPRLWFGFLNALIIAFGIVATGVARAYSLRLRSRREHSIQLSAELAEARLDALRRQLDPHFLFNTLNAVSSLVERDPRGVRRMIARLGDLLRHSFEGGREPEVPLRQELMLLGLYVDIMRVRFQGRLTVTIRVDDVALDALVPSLILQPLVENAIKHGVERRTEGGSILVEGTRAGGMLVLRVLDDGATGESAVAREPAGTGVGLRNTKARLEHLYGSTQRFSLTHPEEGGAVAEVHLPFHTRGGMTAEVNRAG